jgi:hypothetical protein
MKYAQSVDAINGDIIANYHSAEVATAASSESGLASIAPKNPVRMACECIHNLCLARHLCAWCNFACHYRATLRERND